MLTPATANKVTQFYAFGNTPADSLVRALPQGVDANLLLLGCGDFRNILYTAYAEQGLPPRKLDFTCCDIVPEIHVRNILFYSFLVDGLVKDHDLDQLWDIYYNMYLDTETMEYLATQVKKLVLASETLGKWKVSLYSEYLRFADLATFADFQKGLAALDKSIASKDSVDYSKAFEAARAKAEEIRNNVVGKDAIVVSSKRSVSPLVPGLMDLSNSFTYYHKHGTVAPLDSSTKTKTFPNPTLATTMSDTLYLHYGSNPIDGYHLATAYAKLAATSPLQVNQDIGGAFPWVKAARTEFRAMAKAFNAICDKIVIRFVTSDALVFCHTLQSVAASGLTDFSAQWHRKQFSTQVLKLDSEEYGSGPAAAPVIFDVTDTSNLADHFGALNLLVGTVPLMSNEPWASVLTELLVQREDSETDTFGSLLCGHTATIALLLGVVPAEYITNGSTVYAIDEFLMALTANNFGESQFRSRTSWKLGHHFSGQASHQQKLHISPQDMASVSLYAYKSMFNFESVKMMTSAITNPGRKSHLQGKTSYPKFHRGSFAAFLKIVKDRVETNWEGMCGHLVKLIYEDEDISLTTNFVQELAIHLHIWDVHSEFWLKDSGPGNPDAPGFVGALGSNAPEVLAVTFVIPRKAIGRLYSPEMGMASPTFHIGLKSAESAEDAGYHNIFAAGHFMFGNVTPIGSRNSPEFEIEVSEDPLGWAGSSPVVASVYVPNSLMQVIGPDDTISLELYTSLQSMLLYSRLQVMEHGVFHTKISDTSRVYVTKFMPGQKGYPMVRPPVVPILGPAQPPKPQAAKITLMSNSDIGKFTSLTGHIDITTAPAKKLLTEKRAEIKLAKSPRNPFVIDVVFGKHEVVLPVHFPVAVVFDGARLRIARKSGWVEIVTKMAEPVKDSLLEELIYPLALDTTGRIPVSLTIPNINLDMLPILDLSNRKDLAWMTKQTSATFSLRERKLRDAVQNTSTGIGTNPRLNFKESLFTIFMLASGLQGGQTGYFVVYHPEKGGGHMMILVSALRLDSPNGSMVADAAVIPLTNENIREDDLHGFLALSQGLEMCKLNVDDGELEVWKKSLPALAERCRTWTHEVSCEYAQPGGSVPISLEPGKPVLCHCGQGKLPDDFISVPYWKDAVPYATRIAISPLFCSPFAEAPFSTDEVKKVSKKGAAGNAAASNVHVNEEKQAEGGGDGEAGAAADLKDLLEALQDDEVCRHCGATEAKEGGGPLKRCMRCREVKYCSAECQKKDWRKHRMECKEE